MVLAAARGEVSVGWQRWVGRAQGARRTGTGSGRGARSGAGYGHPRAPRSQDPEPCLGPSGPGVLAPGDWCHRLPDSCPLPQPECPLSSPDGRGLPAHTPATLSPVAAMRNSVGRAQDGRRGVRPLGRSLGSQVAPTPTPLVPLPRSWLVPGQRGLCGPRNLWPLPQNARSGRGQRGHSPVWVEDLAFLCSLIFPAVTGLHPYRNASNRVT